MRRGLAFRVGVGFPALRRLCFRPLPVAGLESGHSAERASPRPPEKRRLRFGGAANREIRTHTSRKRDCDESAKTAVYIRSGRPARNRDLATAADAKGPAASCCRPLGLHSNFRPDSRRWLAIRNRNHRGIRQSSAIEKRGLSTTPTAVAAAFTVSRTETALAQAIGAAGRAALLPNNRRAEFSFTGGAGFDQFHDCGNVTP